MTNERVSEIHDKVFEHLMKWHQSCPKDELNPYFYIRTRNDERFGNGYWFPGDNNYLALSFWAGGDTLNKTQNIYLNIDYEKGMSLILTGRDSEYKQNYFEKLAKYLDIPNGREGFWSKHFASFDNSYLIAIQSFIQRDKILIDDYIQNTINLIGRSKRVIEDSEEYSTPFGFIEPKTFDKHSSRVLQSKAARFREKQFDAIRDNTKFQANIGNLVNSLPIAIESIEIEKFRGIISSGKVEMSNSAQWIFVTGENGYGKSSFLQAVALGVTNFSENRDYIRDSKINVTYSRNDKPILVSTSFSYDESSTLLNEYFIGYGPIRLIAQSESLADEESTNLTNIYSLFHYNGLLKSLKYLMTKSKLVSDAEFDKLKRALITVLDNRVVDIKFDPEKGEFIFTERLENGEILNNILYSQLASGFINTLNLVGDIISRLSKSQPDIPFENYVGIVIIDELENHLHPKMQRSLPGLLSKVFPKIQFIVSTHSPIPLLGAPANSVVLKVKRNKLEGIIIEKLDVDFSELLPNSLLTSPIFGFTDITPISHSSENFIRVESSYAEVQINDKRRKEIDYFLTDERKEEMLKLLKIK